MSNAPPQPDAALLTRNLSALARSNPRVAELVRNAVPSDEVAFTRADDGAIAATHGVGPAARQLCSRRRPLDEARTFAEDVNPTQTAVGVVLGFGVGHHVAALADRLKGNGLVIVYEPDLRLMRSVMEHVDCAWLGHGHVAIVTDAGDRATLSRLTSGFENVFLIGTRILTHAPSKARLGDGAQRFAEEFTGVLKAVRTTLVTTLVQADVTLGNAMGNVGPYAMADGIEDLRDAARGRAAIVVSGGPSLRRNMHLLAQPGVRDRFVIIAVQTVLKPLLAIGVKPHFVTALDYAQISKRFYEGLTTHDVEGVTLVAEAKGNPAIVRAFPGAVRFPADEWLNTLLGDHLARDMGQIKPGATVAHLAYYLARHLGCDPVILIGQDLGYTDGQYYGSGAVIHDTWAPELNEFRSLEMLEWERIVRARRMLRKATDHLGRPVYTDEQLATYLVQFERDFLEDSGRNLRIIDATEGGVAKAHTQTMPLAEAISRFGDTGLIALPSTQPYALESAARRDKVLEQLRRVRRDVWQIGENARAAAPLLEEMQRVYDETARLNVLIDRAQELARKSHATKTAYHLVHYLNQTGSFNRYKADRAIGSDASLSEDEKQKRSIQRDLVNVRWLADAADEVGKMLMLAIERVEAEAGGRFVARDDIRMVRHEEPETSESDANAPREDISTVEVAKRVRVEAVLAVDTRVGGMGTARDLSREHWRAHLPAGSNPLALTIARLLRSKELDGITLLTHEPTRVRELLGQHASNTRVRVVTTDAPVFKPRASAMRARLFSRAAWRGGVANLSVFDECFEPVSLARAMHDQAIEAAVLIGADWPLVDSVLIDAVIARHREDAKSHRCVFTQAAPGLCGALVSRDLADELARNARGMGSMSSLGAILGYIPVFPQVDPIAKPSCVSVPTPVRDAYQRFIADEPGGIHAIGAAFASLGEHALTADALTLVGASGTVAALPTPRELTVETTTRRAGMHDPSAIRNAWLARDDDPHFATEEVDLCAEHLERVLETLGPERASVAVTFAGRGDALLAREFVAMARLCRASGVGALHVRTDLNQDEACIDALLDECREAPVDVLSVDVLAERAETYARITGVDAAARVQSNLSRLIGLRGLVEHGLPTPWIVPRLTRCDAVYAEVEAFYDRWTHEAGCAVIDPLPRSIHGQRIDPIVVPSRARRWRESGVIRLRADGTLCDARGVRFGHAGTACEALRAWSAAWMLSEPAPIDGDIAAPIEPKATNGCAATSATAVVP